MIKLRSGIRVFTAIAMLAMGLIAMPSRVMADGVDPDADVSLTIHAEDPETKAPVAGMRFNAYRVAELKNTGEYAVIDSLNDDIKSAYKKIDVPEPSAEDCAAFARTVAGYFTSDRTTPTVSGVTGNDGIVRLDGEALKSGMYVVASEQLRIGNRYYTAGEFLIALPTRQLTGPEWLFNVEVSAKMEVRVEQEEVISRRVLKRWVGDGGSTSRPAYVEVELLRNGQTYDTQRLSADNGWAYQWNNLNPNDRWTMIERNVAPNYSVSVNQEGITMVVTNTFTPPNSPPVVTPPPTVPVETPDTVPEVTGVRREEPGPDIEETIGEVLGSSRLPQTGVLWWPVPILFIAGGVMFAYGFADIRKEDKE